MPLNELEILVARCGHDVVAFGPATTLCRNLGFSSRLLVGLEPRTGEQWVEIAAGSADLTIGIRDADRSVRWLGQPERVSEDALAWTLPDRGAQPVSWLEIASEPRRVRVRLADAALALLSEHGWREAIDDSVAEPVLWVADLLEGIAKVLTGIAPTSNGSNRWPRPPAALEPCAGQYSNGAGHTLSPLLDLLVSSGHAQRELTRASQLREFEFPSKTPFCQ